MTDNLRRRATIRKASYFGLILALFTLSMFWRGVISLPFGNPARAGDDGQPSKRLDDRFARLPILKQADTLELRELDSGDPEVAGSAARHSMLGMQGIVITLLWDQAIQKQMRGEYHDFELLVNIVTELQPNFIQPWLFQSWNISYNVSVENEKLGDMYFYIARGIDLLAKGDRRNTKVYRGGEDKDWKVGSPDIRFTIGFYYQNKFSVSDKVDVLRSLMQVSAMKPSERDPDSLTSQGQVDDKKFQEFCERNPQFVRRLQTKLNRKSPAAVVDFLRTNRQIPSRYNIDGKSPEARDLLVADESQFPIFPPPFPGKRREMTGRDETNDSYDAFLASRGWYEYAQVVVPPPVEGEPAAVPHRGEYDEYKYRIPTKPALILFRMQPSRAQTYLGEYLQKEGWFDETTRWDPDELVDPSNAWFAKGSNPRLALAAKSSTFGTDALPISSLTAYTEAHAMWEDYGRTNGLLLTPTQLARYEEDARKTAILGAPGSAPPDFTDDQLQSLNLKRSWVNARRMLVFYKQNESVTNFPFFFASTQAEASREMVDARKFLWEANRAYAAAKSAEAIRRFTEANAKWRLALQKHEKYHNGDRSDTVQEFTAELELKLMKLLMDERKVPPVKAALQALVGHVVDESADRELSIALAEVETANRIATEILKISYPAAPPESLQGTGPYSWLKTFTSDRRDIRWINVGVREMAKMKEGLMRRPEAPPAPPGVHPLEGEPGHR